MDTHKHWAKSKTMRWAVLLAGLGLAILTLPEFDLIVAAIPIEYAGIAALLISGITAGLRVITDKPLSFSKSKDENKPVVFKRDK